jgi:hypothetical protein
VAGNDDMPPGATQVEFTLTPTPAGTRLRLEHRGLPPGQASIHATGWQHFLGRLTRAVSGDGMHVPPLQAGEYEDLKVRDDRDR